MTKPDPALAKFAVAAMDPQLTASGRIRLTVEDPVIARLHVILVDRPALDQDEGDWCIEILERVGNAFPSWRAHVRR